MRGVFDPIKIEHRLNEINQTIEDSALWNDKDRAQKILKEKSLLENQLNNYKNLSLSLKDAESYLELAENENDSHLLIDINNNLSDLAKKVANFEIECLFSAENDHNNCFVDINAGAGGTDSCDFALMLLRMYERFANIRGFKAEIIDILDGEEAGIRSAILKISGQFAYGWLKNEIGIHRLVRISPFNSNGKRQTSFASVWAYPEIDDEINIDIQEKDLRIDTFRASGAGGQHVNKTDSAVRITHLPTNIAVQCQSDRSQIRNRAEAMKMLKSKLYEIEMNKKRQDQESQENAKSDNSFGHQIRSYVLHPYQLVKDLRTNFETGNIQAVLDGEIEGFIKAMLAKNIQNNN
ncbi:MAG: peptide chain release factor 2 [Alphaproteobacteria bacterium]|nr:peptide chain release factor 2 [Alphaproteobacteria bacterium]